MTLNFEIQTRRKIYNLIQENPGIYPSELARILELSTQLVDYHILYLERNDLINVEKGKGYNRCFVKDQISSEDKKILSILRQITPLKIVLYLLKYPGARNKHICKDLEMSSPHLSYHLKKLMKNDIVITDVERGYAIKNKKKITNLLIKYKPSTMAKMVDDTWKDFGPG